MHSNNSSPKKIRPQKNVKQLFLRNQLSAKRAFLQFIQQINNQTKQTFQSNPPDKAYKGNKGNISTHNIDKKRNSFALKDNELKNKLNSGRNQALELFQEQNSFQKYQKFNQIALCIKQKKSQILREIQTLKNNKYNDKMVEQNYFYLTTSGDYQSKLKEIEQRIQFCQSKLQGKQRQKKVQRMKIDTQSKLQNIVQKSIKFSNYKINSPYVQTIHKYLSCRERIKDQLIKINKMQSMFQRVKHAKSNNKNNKNSINDKYIQKEHSINNAKIKQNKQQTLKPNIKQFNQKQILKAKFLSGQLSKQIISEQLSKVKNKIQCFKLKSQTLQNSIKQLQAYKALLILRQKKQSINQQSKSQNKHNLQKTESYQSEQVLRLILEHQFLTKMLIHQQSIGFTGLKKINKQPKQQSDAYALLFTKNSFKYKQSIIKSQSVLQLSKHNQKSLEKQVQKISLKKIKLNISLLKSKHFQQIQTKPSHSLNKKSVQIAGSSLQTNF